MSAKDITGATLLLFALLGTWPELSKVPRGRAGLHSLGWLPVLDNVLDTGYERCLNFSAS